MEANLRLKFHLEQHGKQFRLKGKGMPILRRSMFSDLYIRVVTQVPTSLSKRQKEILEEFNKIESSKPDPVIKSFFEKTKNFERFIIQNGIKSDNVCNISSCSACFSATKFSINK